MTGNSYLTNTLWIAVDQLTKPTRRIINRDDGTTDWGTVPSLWDQGSIALRSASEVTYSTPLAERAPCDIDLMEIRGIIRDTTARELHRLHARRDGTVPAQLRRLASTCVAREPEQRWWWEYRFAQWARLLETYLGAAEKTPRPTRLRAPCPVCRASHVLVDTDYGPVVAPPILIDFRDGFIRAARCEACAAAWFRGDQLHQLADALDTPPTPRVLAVSA